MHRSHLFFVSTRESINYYTKIMSYYAVACQYTELLSERKINLCVLNCVPTETLWRLFIFSSATSPKWTPPTHS